MLWDFLFTVFSSSLLHFSCLSLCLHLQNDYLSAVLQMEKPNIYKRHNLLAFKRLFFHSAQKVQALRSSCISLVTDNGLMQGSKIYLQYVLVWYYLLGNQNSLGCILFLVMFTEHLLLPALSLPSGRKGCKLFSPQLASPERALNISAHGKWEGI